MGSRRNERPFGGLHPSARRTNISLVKAKGASCDMRGAKRVQLILASAMLSALLADAASAQGMRARSDMLFEPWKAAPVTGGLKSYGNDRAWRGPIQRTFGAASDEALNGRRALPANLRRQTIEYPTTEPKGTVIVDTKNTYLYLVLGNGQAMRYGIGVGREGFTWSGRERITKMAEWPDWRPPTEMLARDPDLPDFVPGGLNKSSRRACALPRGHALPDPRHQRPVEHRHLQVIRVYPNAQCRRHGSLPEGVRRYTGCCACKRKVRV